MNVPDRTTRSGTCRRLNEVPSLPLRGRRSGFKGGAGLSGGLVLLAVVAGMFFMSGPGAADAADESSASRSLVIIVDGLRPDYVTPEIMPNVHAMGERGVVGEQSFAVFPSFTRPNRVSIPTGSYPRTHGLVHNHLYHPDLEDPVHTSRPAQMAELEAVSGTPMVTAETLGEMLDEHGDRLLALGNSCWLMNHLKKGKGYWEPGGRFSSEAAKAEVTAAIGDPPSGGRGPARTEWEADSYLYDSLGDDPAEVVLMWMGEPDAAGHAHGVGAPKTLEALASVDRHIGRILDKHEEHGLTDEVNIFITSDHGFTQNEGTLSFGALMAEADLGDHAHRQSNMIWIKSGEYDHFQRMVEVLQRDRQVGNVYTPPKNEGDVHGKVPGTLSTDLIQWTHERSSDIIFTPAWSDDVNEYGWHGVTTRRGTATHGSDSPFDMHIPLIAFGPDIKEGVRSRVPTGNVDFVPTILHLRGLDVPDGLDGRVMHEILRGGPDPDEIEYTREIHRDSVFYDDGFGYEAAMETFTVDGTIYLRGAQTRRTGRSSE